MSATIDPITLEILSNGLRSITDETYLALMKSAYSTNIKERCDHSTALMDRKGRLIVQADRSLPIHLGSMMGLLTAVLRQHRVEDMVEGDIFVANDPYEAGGTHLPDVNLAMPVFVDGQLICFVCNIAHHADIGGMSPGSMAGGMTEIYQEGLRIPVVRLFKGGQLVEDILALLLLNARVPQERRGDYFAQVAACRLGARRVQEVVESFGTDVLLSSFDEIIRRTRTRMQKAISSVPDGVYQFEDVMDDDGVTSVNIPIKIKITVKGEDITFDFSGTSLQVRGNINLPFSATQAAVLYTLKSLIDPDAPNNQGLIESVNIIAPEGTMVNAIFPAAVAARANTCQRVVDVIIGALADALPKAAVGAANGANTTTVFFGTDPRTQKSYVYLETLGGGFGGRATKDGKDGVQVHITNTSNLPTEAIEMEYPLMVESYGFVENSGGPGTYRGGAGIRRVIRPVDHVATFSGQGERFRNPPWGIFGGKPGRTGKFYMLEPDQSEKELPTKPSGLSVTPQQAVVVETPGAGGYGSPDKRSPDLLEIDKLSGKFDEVFLRKNYASYK